MKKWLLLLLLVCFSLPAAFQVHFWVVAQTTATDDEIEETLSQSVLDQLQDLNFSNFEEILSRLSDDYDIFGSGSFQDKILAIINGTYFSDYNDILDAVFHLVLDGFVSLLPLILTMIALTVLSSIVSNLKSTNNPGVTDMIHFVCFAVTVILMVSAFVQVMKVTQQTLNTMTNLMDAAFPILLTLLTATGAVTSVSIYKPVVAILTSGVTAIFEQVLYPLFILSFIFVVISSLSNTIKLNKFNELIASIFKWTVGFIFTLFSGFLMVQGISAGKFDSVSIKATKFAVKSYIPIVGSFISDGFDFIILSSVLIKNAIGVGVLFLIFLTIISPIIQIVVLKLGLQLTSAVLGPVGNSKMTSFTSSCAKILVYPIAIMVGVSFMFLLSVALMMVTANIF